MTPRRERIAYQCWWLIQSTAGECTTADMADLTGARATECALVCSKKGWGTMYRKVSLDRHNSKRWAVGGMAYDASLDALGAA